MKETGGYELEKQWMIYGANGYTGELIARESKKLGLKPILAGRNRAKVEKLAGELGFESRVFPISDIKEVSDNIKDIFFVLHCAGPFIETSQVMAAACISSRVHYLDITGEIPVFQHLQGLDEKAKINDVMLLPGVGFDIVPTDCLAKKLKEAMPEGRTLRLGFFGLSDISRGTLKSMLKQIPNGSMIRRNGRLEIIPQLSVKKRVRIQGQEHSFFAIPWGDVFTAYYSTGIENISVFFSIPEAAANFISFFAPFTSLLKLEPVLQATGSIVDIMIEGPNKQKREEGRSFIWGEIENSNGEVLMLQYETREGYRLTVDASLIIIEEILNGKVRTGFCTPSMLLGSELLDRIPGTKIMI